MPGSIAIDKRRAPKKPEANYLQFTDEKVSAPKESNYGNQEQMGANTKGTGRRGVPVAVAEASKRRVNIKLPANF